MKLNTVAFVVVSLVVLSSPLSHAYPGEDEMKRIEGQLSQVDGLIRAAEVAPTVSTIEAAQRRLDAIGEGFMAFVTRAMREHPHFRERLQDATQGDLATANAYVDGACRILVRMNRYLDRNSDLSIQRRTDDIEKTAETAARSLKLMRVKLKCFEASRDARDLNDVFDALNHLQPRLRAIKALLTARTFATEQQLEFVEENLNMLHATRQNLARMFNEAGLVLAELEPTPSLGAAAAAAAATPNATVTPLTPAVATAAEDDTVTLIDGFNILSVVGIFLFEALPSTR